MILSFISSFIFYNGLLHNEEYIILFILYYSYYMMHEETIYLPTSSISE